MAKRARSTTEEVKPSDVSMVSHPNAVTKLVETGRSYGVTPAEGWVL
jgi:hypothetical protein